MRDARISGQIMIQRPVEDVFDFVADERNEPLYNPWLERVELVTAGPIGAGTRFRAETRQGRRTVPMTIEFTDFRRPARLASATRMAAMEIVGELAFEPVAGATRMRWHWTLRPHGALRAARPLIAWLGNRQERRIWSALKRHLEA